MPRFCEHPKNAGAREEEESWMTVRRGLYFRREARMLQWIGRECVHEVAVSVKNKEF